jgi:DnaJ-domain-containing protein 1
MREYHPDKVAHLGEALQTLAHEKSQEIQRAYRALGG